MTFPAEAPARDAHTAYVIDHAKPVPDALRGAVVALGNFDGVHRGHAELARVAREMAGPGGKVAALTFEPYPRSVFKPE